MHLTNLLIFIFRLWLQILHVHVLTPRFLMLFIQCIMGNFYIYLLLIKVNYLCENQTLSSYCDFDWFSLSPWTEGNIVAVIDVIHIAHAAIATVSCLWTFLRFFLYYIWLLKCWTLLNKQKWDITFQHLLKCQASPILFPPIFLVDK